MGDSRVTMSSADCASRFKQLRQLLERGMLTEDEYLARKALVLNELAERGASEAVEDLLMGMTPLVGDGTLSPEEMARLKAIVLDGALDIGESVQETTPSPAEAARSRVTTKEMPIVSLPISDKDGGTLRWIAVPIIIAVICIGLLAYFARHPGKATPHVAANDELEATMQNAVAGLREATGTDSIVRELAAVKSALAGLSGEFYDKASCERAIEYAEKENERAKQLNDEYGDTSIPDKPEKPSLNDSLEVMHLCGRYRGRYTSGDGGIVVTRGQKYYVIEGAETPLFSTVCGYVRWSGTTTLDIEGGRDADVMEVSDAQAYREGLQDAKENFASAMAEYKESLKKWRDAQDPSRRVNARAKLLADLSTVNGYRSSAVAIAATACESMLSKDRSSKASTDK